MPRMPRDLARVQDFRCVPLYAEGVRLQSVLWIIDRIGLDWHLPLLTHHAITHHFNMEDPAPSIQACWVCSEQTISGFTAETLFEIGPCQSMLSENPTAGVSAAFPSLDL